MALLLETLWGDLVIDLDIEGSPELCKNILKLAYVRYYSNTLIFSVTAQRFCQLGCPVGDGSGGACIYGLIDTIQQQANTETFDYRQSKYRFLRSVGRMLTPSECQEKGRVVATLLNTADTIGSQFLITTSSGPNRALDGYISQSAPGNDSTLAPQFLSLGKVVEDDNGVLDKINAAYTDPNGRPYADIRIIRALIIYDPFPNDDIPGLDLLLKSRGVVVEEVSADSGSGRLPRRVIDSPSPVQPTEESVPKRISAADVILEDDDDEIDEEERTKRRMLEQEDVSKKVDHSRAVVLEMSGDLPDANIRAPENVLFICKLNPATIDEDLELIFSRFDERVKVEIIRDHETGASLQYAFAEFSNEQAAAEAYFKMNNALIDDRRIKVDFSQSVAKLWDKYNQRMRMPRISSKGGRDSIERTLDRPNGNHLRSAVDSSHHSSRSEVEQASYMGRDLKQLPTKSHRNAVDLPDERNRSQYHRSKEGHYKDDAHRQHSSRRESSHRSGKHDRDTRYHDRRGDDNGRDYCYERKILGKSHNRHARDVGRINDSRYDEDEEYEDRHSRQTRADRNFDNRFRSDDGSSDPDESDVESRHRRRRHKNYRERLNHDEDRSVRSNERRHKRERSRRDDDGSDRKRHKHSHKHKKRERERSRKRYQRSRSDSS